MLLVDKIAPSHQLLPSEEAIEFEKKLEYCRDMKKIQRSLQGVCRQISQEWAPVFFSTTTMVIKCPQHMTVTLGDVFKKTVAERKLNHSTRLKCIYFLDWWWSSFCTGKGLISFLQVLCEHRPRLLSLTEVTYSAVFDQAYGVITLLLRHVWWFVTKHLIVWLSPEN